MYKRYLFQPKRERYSPSKQSRKKLPRLAILLLITLCFTACSAFDDDFFSHREDKTLPATTQKYQVSLKSATYFANRVSFDDSTSRQVSTIEPIAQGKDTLLYVVNFANNHGWLLLSGDKRTEAVLGSAQKGHFDKNHLGGAALWVNDIAGRVYAIRQANPEDTTAGAYRIWCNIDTLALELKKFKHRHLSTRSLEEDSLFENEEEYTDYDKELVETSIKLLNTKVVGPLIKTKWGQDSPWNEKAPFLPNQQEEHCPTGCAAVAGAQMLYYFHYLKNKPAMTFSKGGFSGSTTGLVCGTVPHSFTELSTEEWDKMALKDPQRSTEGTQSVARLMAYVGLQVQMIYGKTGSSAKPNNLLKLYNQNGITAELSPYDPSAVIASLNNKLPVNILAYTGKKENKFLFIHLGWDYLNGHIWIIDGYKDVSQEVTYTYQKIPRIYKAKLELEEEPLDNPPSNMHLVKMPRIQTVQETYISSNISFFMNWGWDGTGDDGAYSIGEPEFGLSKLPAKKNPPTTEIVDGNLCQVEGNS